MRARFGIVRRGYPYSWMFLAVSASSRTMSTFLASGLAGGRAAVSANREKYRLAGRRASIFKISRRFGELPMDLLKWGQNDSDDYTSCAGVARGGSMLGSSNAMSFRTSPRLCWLFMSPGLPRYADYTLRDSDPPTTMGRDSALPI